MPLSGMLERWCDSIDDVRAATANRWGVHRIRSVLTGLPSVDDTPHKGRAKKLFRASDVLLRCRQHARWSNDYEMNLLYIVKMKESADAA